MEHARTIFSVKLSINNHIVGLVHKNHTVLIIRTRLMYHAAYKVEFQPFTVVLTADVFPLFVKFGEFVQLDVACPMKPKQTTQTCAFVVDCFRREIHQSREAGPPERPQPEARRSLAQSKPPTAPQKIETLVNPLFHPSLPLKPHEHRPGDDFAQKFDRRIHVAAGRVVLWGGASPPKRSQER